MPGNQSLLIFVLCFCFFDVSGRANITKTPEDSPQIKVTFFGVSTLLFDDGETQILIDGFFSRPSLSKVVASKYVGRKIESDTALINEIIDKYDMHRVAGIFVSHSHYDHAFDVVHTTRKTGATLFGSPSTINIGRGGQLPESQLQEFRANIDTTLGKFIIRVLPASHSPHNRMKDTGEEISEPFSQPAKLAQYAEGGSYDFYIQHGGHSMFVKASPNYEKDALKGLQADVVFLGIIQINKESDHWQEKFYEENVRTLKPSLLIPIHWDNFFKPLSDNLPMVAPVPFIGNKTKKDFAFIQSKAQADGLECKTMQGTKSMILF